MDGRKKVKAISLETFVFLFIFIGGFAWIGHIMGVGLMFKTMMATAHDLLLQTVFLIMAMAVLAGAISGLLSEFGAIALINKIFAPLMKPLYGLPGASITGVIATYLSDNPAIIPFAKDKTFTQYFKKYQVPALCNLGTSYGMGLILTTFMIAQGKEYIAPALIGNLGAVIGSVISVRLMIKQTRKYYGVEADEPFAAIGDEDGDDGVIEGEVRLVREGNLFQRVLDAMLEGGKNGVEMGMDIIPGVLIVCTIVMMLTFGPSADGTYTGAAYEGVKLLPYLGQKISFIIEPLFGFQSPEAIAFPVTSLGAVGAAMSLVPEFIKTGVITPNDIAVFTAMGMCWSGYLSTHIGMMDALDSRPLASKAILSHTVGGLAAGISAHFLFMLIVH
ncbi:CD0519/CD1768 family membrane protein [Peptostreptococcus russellii]|uniref:CD0519/CD1768 family membrane protein n=1 Tax=Peptostreptococcus russellii TaxID=215200 RepID=UPI003F582ABE